MPRDRGRGTILSILSLSCFIHSIHACTPSFYHSHQSSFSFLLNKRTSLMHRLIQQIHLLFLFPSLAPFLSTTPTILSTTPHNVIKGTHASKYKHKLKTQTQTQNSKRRMQKARKKGNLLQRGVSSPSSLFHTNRPRKSSIPQTSKRFNARQKEDAKATTNTKPQLITTHSLHFHLRLRF